MTFDFLSLNLVPLEFHYTLSNSIICFLWSHSLAASAVLHEAIPCCETSIGFISASPGQWNIGSTSSKLTLTTVIENHGFIWTLDNQSWGQRTSTGASRDLRDLLDLRDLIAFIWFLPYSSRSNVKSSGASRKQLSWREVSNSTRQIQGENSQSFNRCFYSMPMG